MTAAGVPRLLGKGAAAASALLLLLAAGGCASSPPPPCPRPGIVSGLDVLSHHQADASSSDPRTITYRTAMLGFGGGCAYTSNGADVRLQVDISATPGPAYQGGPMPVKYFVAVADPKGAVVDKKSFSVDIPAATGTGAVIVREKLQQTIKGATAENGAGYRIYLGLDMPESVALKHLGQ